MASSHVHSDDAKCRQFTSPLQKKKNLVPGTPTPGKTKGMSRLEGGIGWLMQSKCRDYCAEHNFPARDKTPDVVVNSPVSDHL